MNAPILARAPHRNRQEAPPAVTMACSPHELPGLLDRFAGIKVLSLDCFDTLLWRDCHAPTDLFATLTTCNRFQRAHGEARARQIARAAKGQNEVSIDAIYRMILPRAGEAQRADAIAAELAAEAQHCYGFGPTIALMHEARRRGIQVILVSDTYLSPRQLHDLVARAAGADIAALIDRVFVSSAHGRAKAEGLYRDVLAKLSVKPREVLHVGDNEGADLNGVAPFGVNCVHLRQFSAEAQQQLRLESAVAAMIDGHAQSALPAPQPHRPALALALPQLADPAQRLGFATLGPVLFGFDRWLRDEAAALAARGGTVHWLFLMRDGHLPLEMHRALGALSHVHAVEISRLTATFAGFARDGAIARHLEENRGIDPAVLARQLRLDEAVIDRLCRGRSHADGWQALMAWCRDPAHRRAIVADATAFARRLVAHVRATVAPAPGDTLMLVDLGYNGTVQSLIDPLLADALQVHVAGRYLILRENCQSGFDKRGYCDETTHDPMLLNALTANVAVIEQLATRATGSVIDYAADGTPLRDGDSVKARQSAVRDEVQRGCLEFARIAPGLACRAGADDAIDLWRRANAATLLRLMYLPLRHELAVVDAFEHDVNLGTAELLPLFDPAIARRGLLQQGLFYQKGARRMYLPAELADEGLATRLTHLATTRFVMPLAAPDFANDTGPITVFLHHGNEAVPVALPIRPTHDGFVSLCIPVGPGRYHAAVPFGALAAHVEIDAVVALPAEEYLAGRHDTDQRTSVITPTLHGIVPLSDRLWHCPDPAGLALFSAAPPADGKNLVILVVFRPIGTPAGAA